MARGNSRGMATRIARAAPSGLFLLENVVRSPIDIRMRFRSGARAASRQDAVQQYGGTARTVGVRVRTCMLC